MGNIIPKTIKMEEKNIVTIFVMPPAMNEALMKICRREERAKAWMIRKAIQIFLEMEDKNGNTNN